MDLVVDSGATKADWIALDNNGKIAFSTQTLGLNPHVLTTSILRERIINNFEIFKNRKNFKNIYFYGAGCGVKTSIDRMYKVFDDIFENLKIINYPFPQYRCCQHMGIQTQCLSRESCFTITI